MASGSMLCGLNNRSFLVFSLLVFSYVCNVIGQVRYSLPEETSKGFVIGNIAEDLGIDLKRLRGGRARIVAGDNSGYVQLNTDKGTLAVSDRIDRELLCKQISLCSFTLEMILENPIELYEVTIEIVDINDHSPSFSKEEISIEISENALQGARFSLDSAHDPDVGVNAITSYSLKPTDHFILKYETLSDRNTNIEMMMQEPLDREKKENLALVLTAVDGGNPPKSGVMKINIIVLDVNDNAPVFSKKRYKASVPENAPGGTFIVKVSASDADKGSNGEVMYMLRDMEEGLFKIDDKSGDVILVGGIDYETTKKYELKVEAKDHGGHKDSCVVIIDVIDVNDYVPVISLTSFTNPVSEDAPAGTTVAVINVKDIDSGVNGQVSCAMGKNTPFAIKSSLRNYYTLLTDESLDREIHREFNITITATDEGSPPLSSTKTIQLRISDVNDNIPIFEQTAYTATVFENNSPGVSLFSVRATDADCCQNSRISYLLDETQINGAPASSLVSINAETGVIYAVRSFDYEHLRGFKISVRAQDGGSPPLSGNATVQITIQDQNDNPPQVLYPVQTGGSVVAEIVPRSADVGYLVTKVVAVDADSGQNAWLSYKLQKTADRALFEVGTQNGEIRTVRQVTDKDVVKQKLIVVVEDNGQPSRSAIVTVNVAVADSFPEGLLEFPDFTHSKDYNDNLTFYLVLALAVVSFLFISCLVVIMSVKIYRCRQSHVLYQSNLPVIPYYPPHYGDTTGTGTLQRVYNYEVCMTTDSRKSDLKCIRPGSQSIISLDTGGTLTLPLPPRDKATFDTYDNQVRSLRNNMR